MTNCQGCKHWRNEELSTYEQEETVRQWPVGRPPHGRLDWGQCSIIPEGWDDDVDWDSHRAAVWDGSEYAAELWTRKDFGCVNYAQIETTT